MTKYILAFLTAALLVGCGPAPERTYVEQPRARMCDSFYDFEERGNITRCYDLASSRCWTDYEPDGDIEYYCDGEKLWEQEGDEWFEGYWDLDLLTKKRVYNKDGTRKKGTGYATQYKARTKSLTPAQRKAKADAYRKQQVTGNNAAEMKAAAEKKKREMAAKAKTGATTKPGSKPLSLAKPTDKKPASKPLSLKKDPKKTSTVGKPLSLKKEKKPTSKPLSLKKAPAKKKKVCKNVKQSNGKYKKVCKYQ